MLDLIGYTNPMFKSVCFAATVAGVLMLTTLPTYAGVHQGYVCSQAGFPYTPPTTCPDGTPGPCCPVDVVTMKTADGKPLWIVRKYRRIDPLANTIEEPYASYIFLCNHTGQATDTCVSYAKDVATTRTFDFAFDCDADDLTDFPVDPQGHYENSCK